MPTRRALPRSTIGFRRPCCGCNWSASALALGVLGMFLASHDRGIFMSLIAAGLIAVMLLVIFDLDRPRRGLITVPDVPLVALRALDEHAAGGHRTSLAGRTSRRRSSHARTGGRVQVSPA